PPPELQGGRMKGVAPVFHVRDAEAVGRELARLRPDLHPQVTRGGVGTIVRVDDPTGHLVFLYQPSEAAMATPSGAKIREILAVPLDAPALAV
ncbi:MAG TPA: hypothetical protein VFQ76_08165, partial [Longimicrobiaceae bacterium]|nr:hypothetical protein [Longimicrobiaceae bacterium]